MYQINAATTSIANIEKKSLGKCHNSVPMTHSNFWKTFKLHFVHTYSHTYTLFMYEFLLLRQKKRVMLHQIEISWHLKTYRFHIMKTVAAISLTWKFSRDLFSKIHYLRTISTKKLLMLKLRSWGFENMYFSLA